jgi:hypothetical protein
MAILYEDGNKKVIIKMAKIVPAGHFLWGYLKSLLYSEKIHD